MRFITNFAGQNWLITPTALAVNEPTPSNITEQKWLLMLSGVAFVDLQGTSESYWLHETLHITPNFRDALDYAVNRYSMPRPTHSNLEFQLDQWAPFAAISSIYNRNVSNDSGFAVDAWRLSPFSSGTDAISGRRLYNYFTGIRVDVSVRDTDAILHRVSYNINLIGRIVSSYA
jgi:hypothetical protein